MKVVPFEIAKKLKEKGFNEDCYTVYNTATMCIERSLTTWKDYKGVILAPTISQVLKWLREKDIMVEIPVDLGDNGVWQFTFRIQTKEFYERATKCDYTSYESAALSCIEYVIDNLI